MTLTVLKRFLCEPDKRLLLKFATTFGWQGMAAVRRFEKRRRRGDLFPAFWFISLTDRCNLACQGCWASAVPPRDLPVETVHAVIDESREQGCSFFGLLGGEPLLHDGLFEIIERHPDCYFQLFTNGTLLTAEIAQRLRRAGNVTPLVSIEGLETVSDERRGGEDVYARSLEGLRRCREARLITGIATSICRSNIDELATAAFVEKAAATGALYLWYYIYRPVGPRPTPNLALNREQVSRLRRFIVDVRRTAPLAVVDAYWDHRGRALCPATVGLAHHVNPAGDVEPCPPLQFACGNVARDGSVKDALAAGGMLSAFRDRVSRKTRGCIIMEDPDWLREFVEAESARDSSGRGAFMDELRAACVCASHQQAGDEIPERSWAYRFAKKHWFFGMGAYG